MFPIFLIFIFLFPPPTSCSFNNQTDLLSLLAFKSAILDPQGALKSWNDSLHFCNWNGIRCSKTHPDRVIEINLRSQGLVGSLSPHIGNLSLLTTLNLKNNTFHGHIPPQITLLRRLQFLDCSSNSFQGPIPRNLSHCPNLVHLNFMDNKLLGTIPSELTILYKLELLSLSKNNITGLIPPSIGNLTSLIHLSLGSCDFYGEIPESISRLQRLMFIQLGGNKLKGTIPKGIFNISTLVILGVDSNELQGHILSNIGFTLPNLRNLVLAQNKFDGSLPTSLSNLSSMQVLEVSLNSFVGKMPKIGGLSNLTDFLIAFNAIQDDASFISSLTNCTNLQRLDLSGNSLSGSLPNSIANLSTQLTFLYLDQTQIHGIIPPGIGNLVGLTSVVVFDNDLDGPIPDSIAKLSNLVQLDAGGNKFTSLPSSLGNLTSLNVLSFNGNKLSGNLPSSLGNCTNLLALDLAHNNFSGLIPKDVMRISSISITFDLSNNRLEGSIPDEVGFMKNVAKLDLSENRLSKPIPISLSGCVSLQELHLQGNSLEGEIPSGMSDLNGLQVLDLSRNNLSGPIPSFLEKFDLTRLNLSYNMFEGEVPTMGVFKNGSSISVEGNRELCGGIPELNLTPCSLVKSKKKEFKKILIPVLVVAGSISIMITVFVAMRRRWRRKPTTTSVLSSLGVHILRLSYADLLRSTDGFSESNLIGVGRFGSVYKGVLSDGLTFVAIKVVNLVVGGASKSFLAECKAIRGIRHRNLLKILSVCESTDFQGNDFKALIYEFKANGSLESWLHDDNREREEVRRLGVIQKLSIAIDIGRAIEYLHCGTDSTVVHGDLKPSNVLLDDEMNACVGDFGLAKIISNIDLSYESTSSIGIGGTLGYIPPEYGTSRSASTQGDAYGYGIILLEMFTNIRPTDHRSFEGHLNLHSFVRAAMTDDGVMEILDPLIQTEPNITQDKLKDCLVSILRIGLSCSKDIPRDRISIVEAVNELQKIQKKLCG